MMLPSRRARPWRRAAIALLALLALSVVVDLRGPGPVGGGSAFGLVYGVVAAALVLVLFAIALRKRLPRSTWGSVEGWLQAHLYLGLVAVAVAFAHAGGRGHDAVGVAALVALVLVVATGIWGARLYATLPRRLTDAEAEGTPDQLGEAIERQRAILARLAAGRSSAFQEVYRAIEAGLRPGPAAGWRVLLRGPRSGREAEPPPPLAAAVGASERAALDELLREGRRAGELVAARERLARLRGLLEAWRYLHLPLAAVLLVLVVAHTVAALRFRGL